MTLPDFLIDHPDGEIRLTGHRISLYDVIDLYQQGYGAQRIRGEYPTLSQDLIEKVITYYAGNQAEVDAYVAAYRAELERLQAACSPGPGARRMRRIADSLREADAKNASDPAWTTLSLGEKLERLGLLNSSKSN